MPTITTGRTTYKAIVPAETTRGCFKKGRSTPSPATVSHASTAASGIPKPTRTIPRILAKRRIAITSLNYSPVPGEHAVPCARFYQSVSPFSSLSGYPPLHRPTVRCSSTPLSATRDLASIPSVSLCPAFISPCVRPCPAAQSLGLSLPVPSILRTCASPNASC